MSKETMEVMARITDSKIKIRDIISEWMLITYDLPNNEEGDRARSAFLKAAASVGAILFTESVYLMPYSPEAEAMALKLAKTAGGEVIVWSQAQPIGKADIITANYDAKLRPLMLEITARIDKMNSYKFSVKHQKRVLQMIPKTERLIQNADAIVLRRGSEKLAVWLELIKERFIMVVR